MSKTQSWFFSYAQVKSSLWNIENSIVLFIYGFIMKAVQLQHDISCDFFSYTAYTIVFPETIIYYTSIIYLLDYK